MKTTPLKWLLAGTVAVTMAAACTGGGSGSGGEIKAVDLVAAWVNAGAPNGAFSYDDMNGNATDATFDGDILPLFTTDGVFGEGTAACTSCHFANSEDSYHEMDLSSYDGLMKGGDVLSQPPGVALFGQSGVGATDYDWGHSKMRERLRNNRMPPGVEFDISEENRDGPCFKDGKPMFGEYGCEVNAVSVMGDWVKAGAKNDDTFKNVIQPMFSTAEYWGEGTAACTDCHFANSEDSYHEMDLSSYDGIMKGGDVLSQPPGVPLFGNSAVGSTDYDWSHSKMRGRLRNNRMPPGVEFDITEENRDGPVVKHGMVIEGI